MHGRYMWFCVCMSPVQLECIQTQDLRHWVEFLPDGGRRQGQGKNGTSWQWRTRRTAGPPQRTCFVELSAERSQRLATLRKWKQRNQCTKEAKKARRQTATLSEYCHEAFSSKLLFSLLLHFSFPFQAFSIWNRKHIWSLFLQCQDPKWLFKYGYHEPKEIVSKKLWLKFPVLAPSKSGNMDQRCP